MVLDLPQRGVVEDERLRQLDRVAEPPSAGYGTRRREQSSPASISGALANTLGSSSDATSRTAAVPAPLMYALAHCRLSSSRLVP